MLSGTDLLEYLNIFGSNLRKHRNALKMSYDEVAKQTGISKSILSRIENGQNAPSFETFLRLHLTLGVTTDFFLVRPDQDNARNATITKTMNENFSFVRKNFIGRPSVSAELEKLNSKDSRKLQLRRSFEENIIVISGTCDISFENNESTAVVAGEIFTLPPNRQSYEISSKEGAEIIRISTPLSQDQGAKNRYIRVLRRNEVRGSKET